MSRSIGSRLVHRLGYLFVAVTLSPSALSQGLGEDCNNPENFSPTPAELTVMLESQQAWVADPASGQPIDLCNLSMPNANFAGMNLGRVTFKYASLPGANFDGANLNAANFHRSNLEGASFANASLLGTVLRKSVLNDADFEGASLRSAILRKSFAERAKFDNASLKDADLSKVYFEDASLRAADLRSSNLRKAKLKGADLRGARLDGANIIKADLSQVNLAAASLTGADLDEATFSYTNLHDVSLDGSEGLSAVQRNGVIDVAGDEFAAAADVTKFPLPGEAMSSQTAEAEMAQPEPADDEPASTQSAQVQETAVVMTSASANGPYRVQVGAFRDEQSAANAWQRISGQHAAVFANHSATTQRADLGEEQGIWYRLQVGSFESKAQASALCARYTSAQSGAGCFAVRAP